MKPVRRVATVAIAVGLAFAAGAFSAKLHSQPRAQPAAPSQPPADSLSQPQTQSTAQPQAQKEAPAQTQQADPLAAPANPTPIYVATFIDLMPPNTVKGTAAIKQYVTDTRKEPGILRCEAIAQIAGRANHLVVIEVWKNQAAFEKHETVPHTLNYRAVMLPLIGAPFDQRVHFLVQ